MLKVSIKCSLFTWLFCIFTACNTSGSGNDQSIQQRFRDSMAEIKIDSAFAAIGAECDSLMKYRVQGLVDAVADKDSLAIKKFSDSLCNYTDTIPKVEKVIRQLKRECDANLLKETYRRVQLLQKVKLQQQHKQKP